MKTDAGMAEPYCCAGSKPIVYDTGTGLGNFHGAVALCEAVLDGRNGASPSTRAPMPLRTTRFKRQRARKKAAT